MLLREAAAAASVFVVAAGIEEVAVVVVIEEEDGACASASVVSAALRACGLCLPLDAEAAEPLSWALERWKVFIWRCAGGEKGWRKVFLEKRDLRGGQSKRQIFLGLFASQGRRFRVPRVDKRVQRI